MENQIGLNKQSKIILYERSSNNRIAEINSFKLFLHDNFRANRKNVIRYSNKFQKYIDTHKLNNNNYEDKRTIAHLIQHDSYYDDIQIISVKGYY